MAQGRECLFGKIVDGKVILSDLGRIVEVCWHAIPAHFPNTGLGTFIVMPNHVHGIIILNGDTKQDSGVGATQASPLRASYLQRPPRGPSRGSVGAIIGSFKSAVSRRTRQEHNITNVWQRNYYEHIIRDDVEHKRIHRYIEANPASWISDDENSLRSS